MDTMRAGRMVATGKLVCEEVEVRPPGEGEVLVRTAFASICGSDLHSIFMPTGAPRFPLPPGYPGHEGIGEVVESRHPDFSAGDRVLTVPHAAPGMAMCFAEYQTIPAGSCIRLPDGDRPLTHYLMGQQLGTVIYALRQHPIDVAGQTCVVVGQGSAGLFFTHLLLRAGAEQVIASDLSTARRDYSTRLGALAVDGPDLAAAVRDHTAGRGADFLVEAVGSRETLAQTMELVRPGATLLWFGLPDTGDPVPLSFAMFFRKRLHAYSTFGAQGEPGLVSFRWALRMIDRGEIDVSPLVSHVFPIEDIDEAVHMAHERTDGALKVSISF